MDLTLMANFFWQCPELAIRGLKEPLFSCANIRQPGLWAW